MGIRSSKIHSELSSEEFEITFSNIEIDYNLQKINNLPELLVFNIYKDYLEAEIYYIIYKNIIESENGKCLNGQELIPLIPIILSKPHVSKYISENCRAFYESFKNHKIEKKKQFKKLNNVESFVATILFSIYH
jgi:hypothetical protein